jgi:hypothetical protein
MLRFACWLAVASVVLLSRQVQAEQPPAAMVHIESPEPVELYRRVGPPGSETSICVSPCDKLIDVEPGVELFVDNGGIPRSQAFRLERPGPVRVAVDTGSSSQRAYGGIFIGVGSAVATAGTVSLLVWLFTPRFDLQTDPPSLSSGPDEGTLIFGIAGVGTGVVMGTIGIILMATSGTRVAVESQRAGRATPLTFSF